MSLTIALTLRRDALLLEQKQAQATLVRTADQLAQIDKTLGAVPADLDALLDAVGLAIAPATP